MSHGRYLLLVSVILAGAIATPAASFVGVDDPCPWPTPYPPAGAGWAVVYNPDFENGFSNNVAANWTGWKDAGLPGQVHYVGTDRKYQGNYSQKLVMPTPQGDMQEAGIYQRMYVVPGGTYIATAKIYLQIADPSGWQLLGHLGLDPHGSDTGDSSATVWDEVSTYSQWVTASVTVQAVLPVMTISLKATRKWPLYNPSTVWFDTVTFEGPIPTEDPPGPDDEPVDPETLIPKTVGANLVSNPSFEENYTDGVSSGWNKWWTIGPGQWKRSQRVGKVGGAKYDCHGEAENVAMRPKTAMLISGNPETDPGVPGTLGSSDFYKTFDYLQDTIIIGRPMVDSNYGDYYSNPTYWGTRLAEHCKNYEQMFPRIDAWLDWNEPDTSFHWQKVIDFSMAFTLRAHQLGLKTVVLNLATGNPGNIWQMVNETYDPHCGDLLAVADYLGHHVYGGPADQLMVNNQNLNNACDFGLRPRRFKDMYDRRGWRFPPVIATEGSTYGGWNTHPTQWQNDQFNNDQIVDDLTNMGNYMNATPWWCGYANFVVGSQCSEAWRAFDIVFEPTSVPGVDMAHAIGNWNYDHPADAMDGYHSQIFGAGQVHPKTLAELTPAGYFNGGLNRQVTGLIPGEAYLLICWMKYEFRGLQPDQLAFYLGADPTGQTASGSAGTIDWGDDQVADKAPVHETFSHIWRTFTATSPTASIWLRAFHPASNPSFKCYVDLVEVRQLDDAPPGPSIEVLPTQIDVETVVGSSPASGSFNIRNSGPGTITYTLDEQCDWLSLDPPGGTSTGELDAIEMVYDIDGLSPGLYECQITATAPEAVNSPLLAPLVKLTIRTVRPDFDGDGDVDQEDFGHLQECLSGEGIKQNTPACADTRLDDDEDVDQDDFRAFQACFTGPNIPPPPDCET